VNTEFLKDLNDKAKESFGPIGKFNELLGRSVQDAFKIQMASGKNYSEFATERLKAMSEVRDMESLQGFFKDQMEAFNTLNEQMMSDMKSLAETGTNFRDEVEALMHPETNKPAPKKESADTAKNTPKASVKPK